MQRPFDRNEAALALATVFVIVAVSWVHSRPATGRRDVERGSVPWLRFLLHAAGMAAGCRYVAGIVADPHETYTARLDVLSSPAFSRDDEEDHQARSRKRYRQVRDACVGAEGAGFDGAGQKCSHERDGR